MEHPSISILMPAKNASSWIGPCIESIFQQNNEAWELIAVDDHSTDQTLKIVQNYQQQDKRIKVLTNTRSGIIPALQQALDSAKGQFITRMDADDLMPAGKLDTLLELARREPHGIATGMVEYFSDDTISKGYTDYQNWLNERCHMNDHWQWIYRECVIASPNWMAHHSLITFDEITYPEDYDLVFNWYRNKLPVRTSKTVTHHWREHADRTSRHSSNYQQRAFFGLKLTRFIEIDYNKSRPLCILGNNKKTRLAAQILDDIGIAFQSFDHSNLSKFWNIENPQLLIGIYPSLKERRFIDAQLLARRSQPGIDHWYL